MIASAELPRELFPIGSTATIAGDALLRIPAAHFRSMTWAKGSIAQCTAMLAQVADGDGSVIAQWLRSIEAVSDAQPVLAVLGAVCDAVIADAFRSRGDASAVSALIISVERDVLGKLTVERRQKDLQALNDPATAELAASLVRLMALHHRPTAIHLDASAALARRIAITMRLPIDQVRTIELAARLHDIGNAGVRPELLRKPAAPTADEWSELRAHAETGAALLAETPTLAFLAPIVRAHHERVDGTGYPDQLAGADIPLEARVIAAADAFHAMSSERPYRRAMSPGDALDVLAAQAGSQFDPDVVEATFVLFRFARSRRQIA